MHKSQLRGVSMNRQSANEKEKIDRHIVLDIDSEENYELFEREPSQLQEFFADSELQGINITIPYKVNALEACDVVDPRAERIGCVNTMVRKDGKWHGYNTDYDGFVFTLQHAGIDVSEPLRS